MNRTDISYLRSSSPRQVEVYDLLTTTGLLEHLRHYDATLVGTLPIGVALPDSDLDIICEAYDGDQFEGDVHSWAKRHQIINIRTARKQVREVQTSIVRFRLGSFPVEVFGQPVEVHRQNGYRHMLIERRVLALGGESVRRRIMELRRNGAKTEPAFAELLGLHDGDPYENLLRVESWSDCTVAEAIRH